MNTNVQLLGEKKTFAIEFRDLPTETGEERLSELSMFVNGRNILGFTRKGVHSTTCWNLDDLVAWLRVYALQMPVDPYPVEADGCCAALKDINSRNFYSEDDTVFDAYYDKLYEWVHRHNWHASSAGAILANVYFEHKESVMEISWNNQDVEEDADFDYLIGWEQVPFDTFNEVLSAFLRRYDETV